MDARVRRIEEASLNAWPALQQMLFDGWLLRMTHGFTKRANSVTPLEHDGARPLEDKIRWCENFYARCNLPSLFRIPETPSQQPLLDLLEARGYASASPTLVLSLDSTQPDPAPEGSEARERQVTLTDREPWLATYGTLTGQPEQARRLHGLILKGIPGDCLYAVAWEDGQPVACGLGVVEDDLLGVFDVATAPAARRRGHARAVMHRLHHKAWSAGARTYYLQVEQGNEAALPLYEDLGYRELYRYAYHSPGE